MGTGAGERSTAVASSDSACSGVLTSAHQGLAVYHSLTMLPVIVFSGLLIVVVGGEIERVLETMYGSRPGNMDSLVIPSREGYYKYEELSETHETSTTDTPDTTVSSTHGQ